MTVICNSDMDCVSKDKFGNCHSFDFCKYKGFKDIETVKHAHWIVVGGDLGYVDCKCSACGYTDCFDDESGLYNYCPECGKKVDEVATSEQ